MNLYKYMNFNVGGMVKQMAIDFIPGYRRYNKWKKKKALRRAGVYTDIGADTYNSAKKIGDDWGDLKERVRDHFGEDREASDAMMKRLYKGHETDKDRELLKKFKI